MSIVKKHLAKAAGKQTGKQAVEHSQVSPGLVSQTASNGNAPREFDLFKAAIESDIAQLKTFSDRSDKASYKSEAIKKNDYLGYLTRYRDSGANHPNIVLAWVVIWLVDLRRWTEALSFLPLLIEQQQRLPANFNTKVWPTFFIDELYDDGNEHLKAGRDAIEQSNVMSLFNQVIGLFERDNWQTNEVVGGKLYAMAAKLEAETFNLGNGLNYCIKATLLNDGAGVKKLARNIAKQIGKEIQI